MLDSERLNGKSFSPFLLFHGDFSSSSFGVAFSFLRRCLLI